MSFDGARFPPLTPRISDLYGASGGAYRAGEADAYAEDLDDLEREERALENMVQELVNRRAAVPIGVKFQREGVSNMLQKDATSVGMFRSNETPRDEEITPMRSSSSEEEEEDMDEDEMMDEEDEEVTTGRSTIVRGERQERDEDVFAQEDNESGRDLIEMEESSPRNDYI